MSNDYDTVGRAISYLERNARRQPSLGEVAAGVGLSEFHFQRLFLRWVGVSPKRFLQYLTAQHAKQLLLETRSLLDASLDAGLSGPGRLHDLLVQVEAVTPGEYKARGAGLAIAWGVHDGPFGRHLVATTPRGVCALEFPEDDEAAIARLRASWPGANVTRDQSGTGAVSAQIFGAAAGAPGAPLGVLIKGTNFQVKVWEALLRIPLGSLATYEDVAHMIGNRDAVRAVASAVGANPVSVLIPCHRVIRKTGAFGDYRWGEIRKKALLGAELARARVRELDIA